MNRVACAVAMLLLALALLAATPEPARAAAPDAAAEIAAGQAIYTRGQLPDGSPLRATRLGIEVRGAAAACVQCHRRSGLGLVEGDQAIAPITGRALFGGDERVVTVMDPVRGKALNRSHAPYTEEAVAATIRAGWHPEGRALSELMPRYTLDDTSMRALLAYLRTLSVDRSPGADEQALRFATVLTPDVEPQRRAAFLQTLRAAFAQKNGSTLPGRRHMVMAAEFTLKTERRWDLEVWELEGPPEGWAAQLDAFYQRSPVFALVSGLSTQDWSPVHRFCEAQGVPCWFPSLPAAPARAEQGAYALYFSPGTTLEARVLQAHLATLTAAQRPRRMIVLQGRGEPAAQAADTLRAALSGSGIAVEIVTGGAPGAARAWREAIARAAPRDAVACWLDPGELASVAAVPLPGAPVYVSAALGATDRAVLPDEWKLGVRALYPYQLPGLRGSNLAYFRTWLNQRGIDLVDEPMQSEVFFAVSYLRDTLGDMLNNLYRDYLIERAESMLSLRESRKANEETLERQTIRQRYVHVIEAGTTGGSVADAVRSPGRAIITPAENLGRRTGTTVYPALGLGAGQRFASKGGYIARFVAADSAELVAESPWLVP